MHLRALALLALLTLPASAPAFAESVDLTFEGINNPTNTENYASILNFYNGGTSSVGTSGPNYGIYFPSNALAICLNTSSYSCSNTSKGDLGDPNSRTGALFFLEGSNTFLNDPGGFTTGFSFNYTAINQGGSVEVYSGLNGTGTLLATLDLGTTLTQCSGYEATFCPFVAAGVTFNGTAQSIDFNGVANQIVFDDVTFGSATPGAPAAVTPEPSSMTLSLTGLCLIGAQLRRRFYRSA